MLQYKLRHPPRKLSVHATDAVVLNRKVDAGERQFWAQRLYRCLVAIIGAIRQRTLQPVQEHGGGL